jgi:glycosyltransferase involved in cell wall biosynthesis
VWNAVDLRRYAPDGPTLDLDLRAGMPRANDVIRIGLVATFARWKGHRTFIEAIAALPPALRVRGYIVGGAVYETANSQVSIDELRAHAAALHVSDRIGFTGVVADSSAAMRALDIVVHASTDPEPFGLAIAEAMACARPVVTSGTGGARELVEPGVNALLYDAGDAMALARAVESLISSRDLRVQMGRAGRATAERSFARHRLTSELTPIYARLARVQ